MVRRSASSSTASPCSAAARAGRRSTSRVWTPTPADYRVALERLRDAGMNMLRVGGTMVYETDVFHDLCDELGILVWQDFMFANMDYPSADAAFARAVTLEARQLLQRLQGRPSMAVLCGNSEVEQQAAMLGLPAERWTESAVRRSASPARSSRPCPMWRGFRRRRPEERYRSTPIAGHPLLRRRRVSEAVRRCAPRGRPVRGRVPRVLERSRRVRWSTRLLGEGVAPGHHPRWKAAVPRDAGAGWDFEDVRDHYVRCSSAWIRSTCARATWIATSRLGRVATGEAMLRTFAEWRRPGSSCRGGLVWFARDLRPGAGWGVVDSTGRPKAAYWYLKRALCPGRAPRHRRRTQRPLAPRAERHVRANRSANSASLCTARAASEARPHRRR